MFHQTQQAENKVSKNSINCSYWLKFELIEFCKANELSTQGSKIQLIQRIKNFLDKKIVDKAKSNSLKNKRRTIKKIS
ncbi:SAP domain-containing protein [Winogradskyella sp. Asnod2-B02-A]|uniref:SAP domain-containing protein n=1 Tax=Winogradskyella sp. Asnod2-B02-A TaxID=3160583 RepID=UPI00386C9CC5